MNGTDLTNADLRRWLRETNERQLEVLWEAADRVRATHVGDEVHLRGLIEISNVCIRACAYCGINVHNKAITRYRMTVDEAVDCAKRAKSLGFGTVVLQGGEDPGITTAWVLATIGRIKAETGLAITLSLGERTDAELIAWKAAGADRYLLRFEASNPELFAAIHPPHPVHGMIDRIAMLRRLADFGYQAGSGVMVGIPGQTWDDLVQDLRTFQSLDLDMIGIGPWLPHPATPLGREIDRFAAPGEQVPNDRLTTLKMVALSRLLVPEANLPATTALATIDKDQGRELGLMSGGNVVMPNLTPPKYRVLYEIYPDKACVNETAEECDSCLRGRIERIGRTVGVGPGASPKHARLATANH
jgi:biotin synthase